MTRVAAVVLAAGAASRFGAPKQVLLLPRVLERLAVSAVAEVVVVEGAHPLDTSELAGARLVRCVTWQLGPGASLRCGLGALDNAVDAAVVVLADGPLLSPAAIARVVEHWRTHGDDIVAASYGGVRGHPVVVGRSVWTEIPDEGLRAVGRALVPCDDLGDPGDVDVPADLVS